jgi:hypothetical protein
MLCNTPLPGPITVRPKLARVAWLPGTRQVNNSFVRNKGILLCELSGDGHSIYARWNFARRLLRSGILVYGKVGLVELFDGVCSTYATVCRDQDYAPAHDSRYFLRRFLVLRCIIPANHAIDSRVSQCDGNAVRRRGRPVRPEPRRPRVPSVPRILPPPPSPPLPLPLRPFSPLLWRLPSVRLGPSPD